MYKAAFFPGAVYLLSCWYTRKVGEWLCPAFDLTWRDV